MKKILFIAPIAAVLVSPLLASSAVCSAEKSTIVSIMNLLDSNQRKNVIDFVLTDQEGIFRTACHKHRILQYISDEIVAGRRVEFNKSYIKFYLGLYMERKFMELDYQELVRPDAIIVANLFYDNELIQDAEQFYYHDLNSIKYVKKVHVK